MKFIIWFHYYVVSCCPMDTLKVTTYLQVQNDTLTFYVQDVGYEKFHINDVWDCYLKDKDTYVRSNMVSCFILASRQDVQILAQVRNPTTTIYFKNKQGQSVTVWLSQ